MPTYLCSHEWMKLKRNHQDANSSQLKATEISLKRFMGTKVNLYTYLCPHTQPLRSIVLLCWPTVLLSRVFHDLSVQHYHQSRTANTQSKYKRQQFEVAITLRDLPPLSFDRKNKKLYLITGLSLMGKVKYCI